MPHKPRWFIRWIARRKLSDRLQIEAPVDEVRRLPCPQSSHLHQVLAVLRGHLVRARSSVGGATETENLEALEESILRSAYEPEIRDPLSVIAYRCAQQELPDRELAWACLCAAEWARSRDLLAATAFFWHSAAAASDTIPCYLAAELSSVTADLSRAPAGASRRRLRRRWARLAEMVAAEGGVVSLSAPDLIEGLRALLPSVESSD